MPEWSSDSRASTMLFPLNILITEADDDNIIKRLSTSTETTLEVNLPRNKAYDIFAVCGIPTDKMPGNTLSEEITVPVQESGDLKEFGMGKTSFTIGASEIEHEAINITAQRQIVWLDVKITGVPSLITDLKLHVQGLADTYSIDQGWHPTSRVNKSIPIALKKNETTSTLFEGSGLMQPGNSNGATLFYVEATTNNGNTNLLTFTPKSKLTAGKHLVETLEFSQLALVASNVSLEEWTNENEEGKLQEYRGFSVGAQYFSYPATVFFINSSSLNLFPHKPMTVTLDEVLGYNTSNVPYTLEPEVNAKRWAIPTSVTAPGNILAMINKIGLEELNRQITSTGGTTISEEATNVLAYYNKNTNTIYRFDFKNKTYVAVDSNNKGTFLLYPCGIIQFVN